MIPRLRRFFPAVACLFLVAGVAVERLYTLAAAPETEFDDAYMFIRYARNLLAGHGLAWNPGEHVYGITGLVHLFVVTALQCARSAWSDARVLQTTSAAFAIATLSLLSLTCARFSPHPRLRGRPLLWAAILLPLVAYTEPFVLHAETGMDTMSSLAANALLLYAVLRLVERPGVAAAALCAALGYLAILARPDNALFALLSPLLAIALVCPSPRRAFHLGHHCSLGFVPLFAFLVGADLAVKRWLLGTALPLAFYAKRPHAYGGFVGEYTWNPFLFLEVYCHAAAPFVVALVLFAGRRHARRLFVCLVPAALTIAALFFINQIMGHLGRFFFPSLPFFVVAAALALDEESLRVRPWQLAARLALAVALLAGSGPALRLCGRAWERRAETQPLASLGGYRVSAPSPLPELDSWRSSVGIARIAAASPPGTSFAMSEHGLVGARAPSAVIVDLVGLHDRAFALGGFSARELMRRRPDAIWMPHWDYTQMIRDLLDEDAFWRDYVFYPDVYTYGVALRREGDKAAALRAVFTAQFQVDYPTLRLDDYAAARAPAVE